MVQIFTFVDYFNQRLFCFWPEFIEKSTLALTFELQNSPVIFAIGYPLKINQLKTFQKLTLTSFTSAKILSDAIPTISIVLNLAGGRVQNSGAVYPEITEKKKIKNDILSFGYLDSPSYNELHFWNIMIEDVVKSFFPVFKLHFRLAGTCRERLFAEKR